MNDSSHPIRFRWLLAACIAVPAVLIATLTDETRLIGGRFLTGFARFLMHNIPAMTPNTATWVPGLAAFILAVAVAHFLLARPLRRGFGVWRVSHTLTLAMFLPLLFATAFLVPGILLHAIPLIKDEPLFHRQPHD